MTLTVTYIDLTLSSSPEHTTQTNRAHLFRHNGINSGLSVDQIADSLRSFSKDLNSTHQKLAIYAIQSTKPAERRFTTETDWFADCTLPSVDSGDGLVKILFEVNMDTHVSINRQHFQPVDVKPSRAAVPKYRFHHTAIASNHLTPNSTFTFIPQSRDLEPNEESVYKDLVQDLQDMDRKCGLRLVQGLARGKARTRKKEKARILLASLDFWLKKLNIKDCNREVLTFYLAKPAMNGTLVSPKVQMFSEAFDQVFYTEAPEGLRVTLKSILKDHEAIGAIDAHDINPRHENPNSAQQVERFLETHTVMGCLICFKYSCEHGEYDSENYKKYFSMDAIGMYGRLLEATQTHPPVDDDAPGSPAPCKRRCYLDDNGVSDQSCWKEPEILLLRGLASVLSNNRVKIPAACLAAAILGKNCCEIKLRLEELGIPPKVTPRPQIPETQNLPWYDRRRKILFRGWRAHTQTHVIESQRLYNYCYHEGPCTAENGCPCVLSKHLCERFCRCTDTTCAHKFTGCACNSKGKTCQWMQSQRQSCVCIQLNRECDPDLCGTCGAVERADPANAEKDVLFQDGCQNCSLQRGKFKSLAMGRSHLEGCGYGLFTVEDIGEGEFVIEYVGEIITSDEGSRREARHEHIFAASSGCYKFSLLEAAGIWLDAARYGNSSRYINHSSKHANIKPMVLYVNGDFRKAFRARQDIRAGEELFFNYGNTFFSDPTRVSEAGLAQGFARGQVKSKKRKRPLPKRTANEP
ncbi:SET domain-containing protein [Colletotrichum zoysiae]|uniref:SET domain-containing protein n=1 Tax=Colletotrichum zoysiae TaxID=1216348 RepID=A0AAD9H5H6_9PEZI|nr:SET domain-containing protein [Colletotrichum zoysiae]